MIHLQAGYKYQKWGALRRAGTSRLQFSNSQDGQWDSSGDVDAQVDAVGDQHVLADNDEDAAVLTNVTLPRSPGSPTKGHGAGLMGLLPRVVRKPSMCTLFATAENDGQALSRTHPHGPQMSSAHQSPARSVSDVHSARSTAPAVEPQQDDADLDPVRENVDAYIQVPPRLGSRLTSRLTSRSHSHAGGDAEHGLPTQAEDTPKMK